MVCAQLVYQIFYDCGKDYQINIDNGAIWSNGIAEDSISISDLLIRDTANDAAHLRDNIENVIEYEYEIVDESMDELTKQLYHVLEGTDNLSFSDSNITNFSNMNNMINLNNLNKQGSLLGPATEFKKRCERLQEYFKINMPLEAMFISAGDMLNHAENLELIGTCDLYVKRS